jgi:folate-binding protein YgfZ
MDADTIPLEAGLEDRAISFTKGCYVGQEVIVRIVQRGHGRVIRRLVGLAAESSGDRPPRAGDRIVRGETDIGRVTSGARSPRLGRAIGLGYVHRDFVEPGTQVTIVSEGRSIAARVARVPFVGTEGG